METTTIDSPVYVNEVFKVLYQRRAIRKFKDQGVSMEIIEQLLEAARMAPSAINKQPWHFYILTHKETIKAFSRSILQSAKTTMIKPGLKEIGYALLHPGSFHLKDGIEFLISDDPIFHGAPVVIFIASDKNNEWACLDIGMCAQNLMLAAKSLGLDTCPIGLAKAVEHADNFEKLRVPSTQQINLAVVLGYGDEEPEVHPRKKDNAFFID